MATTALITGITGQDGSYLSELLLSKGYRVVGLTRRSSSGSLSRLDHLRDHLTLVPGDLTDSSSLVSVIDEHRPDEIYNLGAMSFVHASWSQPFLTTDINATGVIRLLEAVRTLGLSRKTRVYQASSSEMFGLVQSVPQSETTRLYPRSPYGVSKTFAHYATVNYRESYEMFAVSGILFNHESPRRGLEFVTRKVSDAVARIKLGLMETLPLGHLDINRDWGFAGDYVQAMWLMLQQDKPEDYVIATGQTHTLKDLATIAFSHVGLDWQDYVVFDERFVRPAEVNTLCGDSTKARNLLDWRPSVEFTQLVHMMVDADLARHSTISSESRPAGGAIPKKNPVDDVR